MNICSVCRRCSEDSAADCVENHGSHVAARIASRSAIAGYRLDFLLERDRASETYEAARAGFDQPFIIRVISPKLIDGAESPEKIQSEMRAAANLNHLNIARVVESGAIGDGEFYTVTETISGQTLGECLRKVGAFPEAEAVMIARHAAEALEAAHKVGVVHRAVSPANIVLAEDGEKLAVKLQNFDFGGIEQRIVAGSSGGNAPIERLRYLSPEQCAGQAADARSDIYSLAVVFYEMLCGRSPFGAPTEAAIRARRVDEQPLERLGFDTRALLKHLLRQSLQNRPEARPQTANSFARQLRHIEQLLGLPGANSSREVSPPLPTANESAAVLSSQPPTPELPDSPIEKLQPPAATTPEIAAPILSASPVTTKLSAEKIEETATAEGSIAANPMTEKPIAENLLAEHSIAEKPIDAAPVFESEPISVRKKAADFDSFAAEPILIRKRAANADSFAAEPIAVKKHFDAELIAVRKKPVVAPPVAAPLPEPPPVFVGRQTSNAAIAAPEVIHLPDADVRETRTTAVVSANSPVESRRARPVPNRRPLLAGAGVLALLAAALLGALLYNRQHQPSAAPPVVAVAKSPAPQTPETTSGATGDAVSANVPESAAAQTEKSVPSAVEKSAAAKPENQPREETVAVNRAPKQNEAAKNQAPRENPTAAEVGDSRPRTISGGDAQAELNGSLADWVTATNTRNLERQMTYYAPKVNAYYRARNASPDSVRAEKKRIFERADHVDISTGKPDITVSPDGKSATMRFRKKYAIREGQKSRSGEVLQELQWIKSGGGWRIVSERDVKVINR